VRDTFNIKVDDDYTIRSDDLNFILDKNMVSEQGKSYGRTIGYYSSIENALLGFVKQRTLASNATSVAELIQEIRELNAYIKGITVPKLAQKK